MNKYISGICAALFGALVCFGPVKAQHSETYRFEQIIDIKDGKKVLTNTFPRAWRLINFRLQSGTLTNDIKITHIKGTNMPQYASSLSTNPSTGLVSTNLTRTNLVLTVVSSNVLEDTASVVGELYFGPTNAPSYFFPSDLLIIDITNTDEVRCVIQGGL